VYELNHPKVKPFTREIASALALDQTFIDFVFADKRPECFDYWIEEATRGWTSYVPEEFDVGYPLWSTNADQTLLLTQGSVVRFAKGWHDHADMEMLSATTQRLLTHLMAELSGAGASDEELKQAAEFCRYRYLDELMNMAEQCSDESWSNTLKQFIALVDQRCSQQSVAPDHRRT
jgi:hypothetical protein